MDSPGGWERFQQIMQYSPGRDFMFGGQDKVGGEMQAIEFNEVLTYFW
jgi:hypothetical protein